MAMMPVIVFGSLAVFAALTLVVILKRARQRSQTAPRAACEAGAQAQHCTKDRHAAFEGTAEPAPLEEGSEETGGCIYFEGAPCYYCCSLPCPGGN